MWPSQQCIRHGLGVVVPGRCPRRAQNRPQATQEGVANAVRDKLPWNKISEEELRQQQLDLANYKGAGDRKREPVSRRRNRATSKRGALDGDERLQKLRESVDYVDEAGKQGVNRFGLGGGQMKWYALAVRAKKEDVTAEMLKKQVETMSARMGQKSRGVEAWVPKKEIKAWNTRTKKMGTKTIKWRDGGVVLLKAVMTAQLEELVLSNEYVYSFHQQLSQQHYFHAATGTNHTLVVPCTDALMASVHEWLQLNEDEDEAEVREKLYGSATGTIEGLDERVDRNDSRLVDNYTEDVGGKKVRGWQYRNDDFRGGYSNPGRWYDGGGKDRSGGSDSDDGAEWYTEGRSSSGSRSRGRGRGRGGRRAAAKEQQRSGSSTGWTESWTPRERWEPEDAWPGTDSAAGSAWEQAASGWDDGRRDRSSRDRGRSRRRVPRGARREDEGLDDSTRSRQSRNQRRASDRGPDARSTVRAGDAPSLPDPMRAWSAASGNVEAAPGFDTSGWDSSGWPPATGEPASADARGGGGRSSLWSEEWSQAKSWVGQVGGADDAQAGGDAWAQRWDAATAGAAVPDAAAGADGGWSADWDAAARREAAGGEAAGGEAPEAPTAGEAGTSAWSSDWGGEWSVLDAGAAASEGLGAAEAPVGAAGAGSRSSGGGAGGDWASQWAHAQHWVEASSTAEDSPQDQIWRDKWQQAGGGNLAAAGAKDSGGATSPAATGAGSSGGGGWSGWAEASVWSAKAAASGGQGAAASSRDDAWTVWGEWGPDPSAAAPAQSDSWISWDREVDEPGPAAGADDGRVDVSELRSALDADSAPGAALSAWETAGGFDTPAKDTSRLGAVPATAKKALSSPPPPAAAAEGEAGWGGWDDVDADVATPGRMPWSDSPGLGSDATRGGPPASDPAPGRKRSPAKKPPTDRPSDDDFLLDDGFQW